MKRTIASITQLVGVLILAAGAALLAPWLGLVVLGIGVIVAGVVMELAPTAPAAPKKES